MTDNAPRIDDSELARLGIRRVQRDVFQCGEYLYTNASDAIAAARRRDSK